MSKISEIENKISSLKGLRNQVIKEQVEKQHLMERRQEILDKLKGFGIQGDNVDEVLKSLRADEAKTEAEIRSLVPDGIEI
ncbi:hypothetical protein D3C78_19030 [compost metagenome]